MDKAQALRDALTRSASYRPLAVRIALANAARTEEEHTCADGWVAFGMPPCTACTYEDWCAEQLLGLDQV